MNKQQKIKTVNWYVKWYIKLRDTLLKTAGRKYQEIIAITIIKSVVLKLGWFIAILVSRQGGKNHTIIDVMITLAMKCPGIKIGFYAPTYTQAIDVTSRRLRNKLKGIISNYIEEENTKIVKFKKPTKVKGAFRHREEGSLIAIFSHDPKTKKEGFTFDLVIIDEAQDLDQTVWEKEIEPTMASTNGTTVFIGTPWSMECVFYDRIQKLLKGKLIGKYLEFPWEYVAKCVPEYAAFIKKKKQELGESSIAFLTQYCLKWISGLGMFFSYKKIEEMKDPNLEFILEPEIGKKYSWGLDVAGDDENNTGKTDWTILTISELDYRNCLEPDDQPVKLLRYITGWKGREWETQYDSIISILKKWNKYYGLVNGAGDNTGMGSPFCARIEKAGFKIDRITLNETSKSDVGHFMDSEVDSNRVKIPADAGVLRNEIYEDNRNAYEELIYQLKWMVRENRKNKKIGYYVEEKRGHDDIGMSLFLCVYSNKDREIDEPFFVSSSDR